MTDQDQIAAFRETAEPSEYDHPLICDECGGGDGDVLGCVQRADIAWPGGRHVQFWLHRDCEQKTLDRIAAMANDAEDFAAWLEKNPEPTLNRLIERFGGYNRITAEAWDENDEAMKEWLRRFRLRNNTQPAPPGSKA